MALQPNLYILFRNSVNNRNINKPNILVIIEVHRLDSLNFTYNENNIMYLQWWFIYDWAGIAVSSVKHVTHRTNVYTIGYVIYTDYVANV